MILFSTFNGSTISEDEFSKVINQARENLGPTPITQIQLKADQIEERKLLQKMGFSCDGIEIQLSVIKLREILQAKNHRLPPDFHLREFSVTKDMESLVQLEKYIHAADTTSRVNFNTDAAVESLKNYYRRAASDNCVFVLMEPCTDIISGSGC